MKTRKLGSQGLEVSAIGLGCMGMTIQYGTLNDKESVATIQHALDTGVCLLNTSDAYGNGENEELIGRAIKGRRDKAILTTKFGQTRGQGSGVNGRPEYVVQACVASLKRLGVEYIDLFCQHRVDPDVPIEDTVGAMKFLIEKGLVRYIGLSEAGPQTIRAAHETHPITCLETEYSLWTRDVETEILPTCRELGIGFVAYAPLGRGFLSGTIRGIEDLVEGDRRREHPRFRRDNIAANVRKLAILEDVARNMNATPAQAALAWLLARDPLIVPIPGTKRRKYLDENAAAANMNMPNGQVARLDAAFKPGETAGERYPAGQLSRLGI
jgi:aryl-alcohol dehydrogenase-like predicted oxidoreductase